MRGWMKEWVAGFEGQRASLELFCLWSCPTSVPALQCPPSPHIPKHLIRPTGTIVQDPLVAFSSALSSFHFVDETWHLACGLFLFLGFFNQSCLCGLLPVASKNTEPDMSLRSLLLDTLEGSRSWECKSPRLWRKPSNSRPEGLCPWGERFYCSGSSAGKPGAPASQGMGLDDLAHVYSQAVGDAGEW